MIPEISLTMSSTHGGLCLQGEAKHSLQRRQRAPRCLIFCLLSLRIRDISAFSLFAYSSLLRFAGLAKGNQFLLLATKMKKKDKEKKGKEEERQEEKEEEGRRIREQSCFPAILALLSSWQNLYLGPASLSLSLKTGD